MDSISNGVDLYRVLLHLASSPETVDLLTQARNHRLLLTVPMEHASSVRFSRDAWESICRTTDRFTAEAIVTQSRFLPCPMPEDYLRAVFQEILCLVALNRADAHASRFFIQGADAADAAQHLRDFAVQHPAGAVAACRYYLILSTRRELGLMTRQNVARTDYLLGRLHHAWSDVMLTDQLAIYKDAGLIREECHSDAVLLRVTRRGRTLLDRISSSLSHQGLAS